jgi:hypothetical protein
MDPNQLNASTDDRDPNPFASKKIIIADAMIFNMKQLELFNIVIYMAAGTIAGISGLTGLRGALVLLIVSIISTIGLVVKMKFDPNSYTNLSTAGLLTTGISTQWLPFVFFWTFSYAMVHIY